LLVREGQLLRGSTVSELGVFGVYLGGQGGELLNEPSGHLLRTKLSNSNEGGVAAGFAVLSSPQLVGPLGADDAALVGRGYAHARALERARGTLSFGAGAGLLLAIGALAFKPDVVGSVLRALGLKAKRAPRP
jgi:hypothetical protein